MPYVSVTRLRLRSRRLLPPFFYYTWATAQEARYSAGFLRGQLFIGSERPFLSDILFGRQPSYWTMTMWDSREAMLEFRNKGVHAKAMRKAAEWLQEGSHVQWDRQEEDLPSFGEAHRRMQEDGHLISCRHPSEAHSSGEVPEAPGFKAPIPLRPAESR